jgi:uncharacterized protein YbjQ (UPF0145 family)
MVRPVEARVAAKYCGHGVVQRVKLGFDLSPEGWEICRGCGLPTFDSVQRPGRPLVRHADGSDGTPQTFASVLVVTSNDVPGHRIEEVFGDVYGVTVRSPYLFTRTGSIFGGEMRGLTALLNDSRDEARKRMLAAAGALGANCVVAMRVYSGEIAQGTTEIGVYGTAVRIAKLDAPEPS